MKTRILIADSHARYRQALRSMLSAQADLEIVGESDNGEDAVLATVGDIALQPNLVIVDVMIEGLDGLEVVRRIRALAPSVHLLALSADDDSTLAAAMNSAGVGGYALKDDH